MPIDQLQTFFANHTPTCLGLVAVTVLLIGNEFGRFMRGYQSISPSQLTALINHDEVLVVDVSANAEFDRGHVIGSRNVVMSQFDPESKDLAKVRELKVAVVCRNGSTSATAARRLVKAGFKNVFWLDGGIAAWQAADLPLSKGRG